MLDVLFILVFAALVQLAARTESRDARDAAATAATAAPPAPATPPDAGVPDATPPPPVPADRAALRDAALAALTRELEGRPAVIARIGADGTLSAVELDDHRIELGVPLLEQVPDPDVAVAYLGDRLSELRICRLLVLRTGLADLRGRLVVIAPDRPLDQLAVALVAGLRRDAERCQREQQGAAVVVDLAAAGTTSSPAPSPSSPSPSSPSPSRSPSSPPGATP